MQDFEKTNKILHINIYFIPYNVKLIFKDDYKINKA